MKLLLLLWAPLAWGACPLMLAGIEKDVIGYDYKDEFNDAFETACSRKNYSESFWSDNFRDKIMEFMARDTIARNSSICAGNCFDNMNSTNHVRIFAPLMTSVREAIETTHNAEVKQHFAAKLASELKLALYKSSVNATQQGLYDVISENVRIKRLSVEAEVAYAQTLKRAFGVVETSEVKRFRIETAMNALEGAVIGRDDGEIAALIEKLQDLIKEESAFHTFIYRLRHDGHAEWIRPIEVIPAVELIYRQYRTLTNTDAKAFIDSFLASWKEQCERSDSTVLASLAQDKSKTAFNSLPVETATALTTTFPELFAYLYQHGYIEKKSQGIF